MGGRKVRDVENVGAAHGAVAILVHRIHRVHIDLHVEVRVRQRVGREIDRRGEFVEDSLEFRAGLHAGEFQTARRRDPPCSSPPRPPPAAPLPNSDGTAQCRRDHRSLHHDRLSDLVKGNMRSNTSSLFQK